MLDGLIDCLVSLIVNLERKCIYNALVGLDVG
jgi:hypothetical protein